MKIARSQLTKFMLLALSLIAASMVFAATGDPVPGVDVSLEQKPGGNRVSMKTTADGGFSFTGLTPGWYVLRVQRPKAASENSDPNAGTVHKNYNSAKSNTAGVAARPATPTGYWLAVEGVQAAEARTLRQVISEDRISTGSEMEVVVGEKGSLSGRITKEAVGLPAREAQPRWGTLSAERRLAGFPAVATAVPVERPVTLRGQIPNLSDNEDGPERVFLVNMDTGQVLAETTLDENGAFAFKTAENPEMKDQGGKEICIEKDGQRKCFTFTLLPADSCQPIAIEDTTLCIDLKSKN